MEFSFFLGNLLLIFGLMKIGMYFFKSKLRLSRLEALQEKFGVQKGTWIYFLIYAALPILLGSLILLRT